MRSALPFLLAALAACGAVSPPPDDSPISGKGRAIDGDTVSIDFRLSGADTFERKQMCSTKGSCYPCGKLAQDLASRILKSGTATVTPTGANSYGRPVAIVTVDGQDLGERMIREGLAVPATQYLRSDPERASAYLAAALEAKTQGRGAYAGEYIDPARWRHGERLACEGRY